MFRSPRRPSVPNSCRALILTLSLFGSFAVWAQPGPGPGISGQQESLSLKVREAPIMPAVEGIDLCDIIQVASDFSFSASCCGDGICEFGELCPLDCSYCGDGFCNGVESCSTCAGDCGPCSTCGDGICNGAETCANCPDCTSCFSYPFYSFYRGESSARRIYLGYSHNGTTWQGNSQLPNHAESTRGPAAVLFNDKIFVFHRGNSYSEIYYSYTPDGQTWFGNSQLANGAQTDEAPGAAVFQNRIYVAHKGKSDGAIWISSSADGQSWTANTKIVQALEGTLDAPSLIAYNNELILFFQHGITQNIHLWATSNGTAWQYRGFLTAESYYGVGLTEFANKLWLGYSNLSGDLYVMSWDSVNLWSSPIRVLTAGASERPSLATDGSKMVVMYKGETNNNNFYAYTFNGTTWYGNSHAIGKTKKGGPFILSTDD